MPLKKNERKDEYVRIMRLMLECENKQAFDALHKLSVRVNAAALFSLLGLLRFIF